MVPVADMFYVRRLRFGLFKFVDNRNDNEQYNTETQYAGNEVNPRHAVSRHFFFNIADELVHRGGLCAECHKEQQRCQHQSA